VRVGAVAALLLVAVIVIVARTNTDAKVVAADEPIEVVSKDADGLLWADQSSGASISANGEVVEFESENGGDVPYSVSVRQRIENTTSFVGQTVRFEGDEVEIYSSINGTISDDGCVVAFWGELSVADFYQLIAYNRCLDVSSVVEAFFAKDPLAPPAVSADGSRIAVSGFTTIAAYDLVDPTWSAEESWTPVAEFQPFTENDGAGAVIIGSLSITDDGSQVAFAARPRSSEFVTVVLPAWFNVFVVDLEAVIAGDEYVYEVISFDVNGLAAEDRDAVRGDSYAPSISGDGAIVAFATCTGLVAGATADDPEYPPLTVHVVDRRSGEMRKVADLAGAPAVSQDGRHVTYVRFPDDADTGAFCDDGEFSGSFIGYIEELGKVRELSGELYAATSTSSPAFDVFATDLVSYTTDGAPDSILDAARPSISDRGRWVAFDSQSGAALGAEDFNDRSNVYVRERPPDLEVSSIAFGEVIVGTSLDRVSTVTNVGLSAWVITSAQLTSGFSLVGSTCGLVIDPGVTCELTIRFTPAAADDVFGTLIVRDESYPARVLTEISRLTGRGIVLPPPPPPRPIYSLIAEPPVVNFAPQTVATASASQTVTIRNNGNITNTLSGIGLSGAHPGDYAITATTCGGAVLAVGGTCTADVRFTPGAEGARTATVIAQGTGGSSATATLNGSGTPPPVFALTIEPPNVGFPFTAVGDTSPARTAVVRNTGNVPNQISSVSTTGSLAADYSVVSSTCVGATLPVGATCIIDVVFRPSDSGPRLATLLATGQGGSSATAVLLGPSLYEPALEPVPTVATIGQVVTVTGSGFPPLSTVELEWAVTDEVFPVQTDATGSFMVPMMVVVRNGFGEREIVARAQPDRFDEVTTEFLLVLNTMQPRAAVMTIQTANNLLSR
jgi:hypothetical protein